MAKLTNKRFYFDYNATSPLSPLVKEYLVSGEVDFLNPSSIHQSGQASRKLVLDCKNFLFDEFSIEESDYNLIFHSGATEGLNTLLLGHIKKCFIKKTKVTFFYFLSDHPCVLEQVHFIESLGFECVELPVGSNGDFDLQEVSRIMNSKDGKKLLNYTYVNNLTGVVWTLDKARQIKEETGALIHVDAVQSIGKNNNYLKLDNTLDCYTYSGHKFGSLKGVGFSFIHKDYSFEPLLYGGGQESGLRSGTQNVLGIHSLFLSLKYLKESFSYEEVLEAKIYIEKMLMTQFGNILEIVGEKALKRNNNTICCIFKKIDTSLLLTALDIQGIEASSGPACSSSINKPAKALLSLGFSEEEAKSSIRFSFSPLMKLEEAKGFYKAISSVLNNFI